MFVEIRIVLKLYIIVLDLLEYIIVIYNKDFFFRAQIFLNNYKVHF